MIALLDYGIGNLRSVEKALETVGAQVQLVDKPELIRQADQIVLPGVGAFGDGMAGLQKRSLVEVMHDTAARGVPILGICLGMQLLFETSEELGNHQGLGLLPGCVSRFPENGLKIPHTGWNQLDLETPNPLLHGIHSGDYTYFNHAYFCRPSNQSYILASTEYGIRYASVVGSANLYGVQFHPEKSQAVGLQILRNFVERCK
jgi:glutamine amidotransferase